MWKGLFLLFCLFTWGWLCPPKMSLLTSGNGPLYGKLLALKLRLSWLFLSPMHHFSGDVPLSGLLNAWESKQSGDLFFQNRYVAHGSPSGSNTLRPCRHGDDDILGWCRRKRTLSLFWSCCVPYRVSRVANLGTENDLVPNLSTMKSFNHCEIFKRADWHYLDYSEIFLWQFGLFLRLKSLYQDLSKHRVPDQVDPVASN